MTQNPVTWNDLPVFTLGSWSSILEPSTQNGLVLLDKPIGKSSFAMVRSLKRYLTIKKIGHTGTLDPAAEGLLILCFGKATKLADAVQALPKVYDAVIYLGRSTASYDRESPWEEEQPIAHIDAQSVSRVLEEQFLGQIEQTPPIYSAIKVGGERLYKKARRGESTAIPSRSITIHRIELLRFDLPVIQVRIFCSKGTYIRSLAHDLGLALQSSAYLAALRRIAIGDFKVDDAVPLSFLETS